MSAASSTRVFRIRQKSSGMYATGGWNSYWSESGGKCWFRAQDVRNLLKGRMRRYVDDTEVVEFDLVETRSTPATEFIK